MAIQDTVAEFVRLHLPSDPPVVRADKIIHDSIWGTVRIRRHEVALMDTPLLQRLRGIHQTSFAYLTYPSAVHTRFEHSLGCLYLAARFVQELREKDKVANRNLVTDEVEQNIRLAALMHDVGHGPFSHSSEEIYKGLPEMADLRKSGAKYHGVKPHEVLSCLILDSKPFRDFLLKLNTAYGQALDAERMIAAICGQCAPPRQYEADILNGPFDVDKIDYVIRDGRLIGLPIAVDLHRLFTAIDIATDSATGQRKLVLDLKGEITLEQIIFGKMTLFTCVYQHHKARACDCMLKAVFDVVKEKQVRFREKPMNSPADFLFWTDTMLPEEGFNLKDAVPLLHELMHGIAFRRVIKRALCISKDFIKDKTVPKYLDFLELRHNKEFHQTEQRRLATLIWELSGKICDRSSVWVDLPKPPALNEGHDTRIRKPNGELCRLNDVFGLDQWTEHYDQHKWVGHVFGPPDHLQPISTAARAVLKTEYGLEFEPIAWELCHLK